MSDIERWSAAKCQRIYDKLDENVGGGNGDPELMLDILIAAWEEMHREAKQTRGAVDALAELVRLKDGPRDDAYRAAKDAAWDAARAVLASLDHPKGQ